jgi:hypothetical protein
MRYSLRGAPGVTVVLVALGLPALAAGILLTAAYRDCDELECVALILGLYLVSWSPLALLAGVPNRLGFYAVIGAATVLTFWALRLPGSPVTLVPAAVVDWLAFAQRERLRTHYFARAKEPLS